MSEPMTAQEYEAAYNTGRRAGVQECQIRIEALRAASLLVAGTLQAGRDPLCNGRPVAPGDLTKSLAEQFVEWLEG